MDRAVFALELGKIIREGRLKKDLNQVQLAEKIDIHVNSLASYERGESGMQAFVLYQICEVLKLDLSELCKKVKRKNGIQRALHPRRQRRSPAV